MDGYYGQVKQSYKPVASRFHFRLMSPLGVYPDRSILLADAAFIVSPELCFSIVRIVKEDWGFAEVDLLAPLDIPLYGGIILSGAGYPYPFSGVTLESETHEALTPGCGLRTGVSPHTVSRQTPQCPIFLPRHDYVIPGH